MQEKHVIDNEAGSDEKSGKRREGRADHDRADREVKQIWGDRGRPHGCGHTALRFKVQPGSAGVEPVQDK